MTETINSPMQYSAEYYYNLSLITGAIVNWLLAMLLAFDPANYIYSGCRRYLRSRYLTALSLFIFGVGFFLHWWFCPRLHSPLTASVLSLSYFHIGGTLFSISHTSLIDRHYLNQRVVVRDISIMFMALALYIVCAITQNKILLYTGFAVFFAHIVFLTGTFYSCFHRVYIRLGNFAENKPNDSDQDVRWLFFSCHLIILFGIGSIVITLLFPNDTLPYTLLMFTGMAVFAYIYKALDNFSLFVCEAEKNLIESEFFLNTEDGREQMRTYMKERKSRSRLSNFTLFSGFFKQWK